MKQYFPERVSVLQKQKWTLQVSFLLKYLSKLKGT